jgi:hypothetical protein
MISIYSLYRLNLPLTVTASCSWGKVRTKSQLITQINKHKTNIGVCPKPQLLEAEVEQKLR